MATPAGDKPEGTKIAAQWGPHVLPPAALYRAGFRLLGHVPIPPHARAWYSSEDFVGLEATVQKASAKVPDSGAQLLSLFLSIIERRGMSKAAKRARACRAEARGKRRTNRRPRARHVARPVASQRSQGGRGRGSMSDAGAAMARARLMACGATAK